MHNHLAVLALLVSTVTSSPASDAYNACVPASQDHPLINGAFEAGTLDPWKVTTIPGNFYPYGIVPARDNLNYTSGHKFWARNNVSLGWKDTDQWDHFYVIIRQNMTTCPGRTYTFSGNYYLPSNNILYPTYRLGPTDDGVSGSERGKWTTLQGTFIAKSSRVEFSAGFDSRNMMNDGDWFMDRLVVRPA